MTDECQRRASQASPGDRPGRRDGYQAYPDAMSPLLERIGGGFRYDFTIATTLRNSAGHEINRVFIHYFPNRQTRDRFVEDQAYREIRGRLFETSVGNATIIGAWEVDAKHTPA